MPVELFKEQLNGKYDGVTPATLLPVGGISGGKNVRKVSVLGGWKPRRGCSTHNTTAIAADKVWSLHRYKHPRNGDYHFIAQCDSKLYDATNDPPASGTTFGTDITNNNNVSNSQPGFSDVIEEMWVYVDGGSPLMWGGDSPFCTGFIVEDDSESAKIDYTRQVTDNRTDTQAVVLVAASDVYYVCSPEIAKGIVLTLGTNKNTTSSRTCTVKAWRSGAWAAVSDLSDGTDSGSSTTHGQSGTISWTAGSDTMRVIGGIMGYWYQVSFSGVLSNSVDVTKCQVQFDLATMTNKWSGVHEMPLSVRFYDQSLDTYEDLTGKLTNESTSQYYNLSGATTNDYIYVKSSEPLAGIGIGIAPGYGSDTGGGNIDQIDYWDGDSWNAITTGIVDETLNGAGTESFAQSGVVWWNATGLTVAKRTMDFDSTPGYWYRISWDAAPDNTDNDVRMYYVTTATFPEDLPSYDGVIEFKGRAMLWGDPEYPNRLRFSAKDRPDCFSGSDSGYTDAFGDKTPIKSVVRFYNELLVFKENSVWMLEGYSPATFGTLRIADTVGIASPKTARVIEMGSPMMHKDEPLSIAIWMDTDGIYALDGRKPRKISEVVSNYFNPESSDAISASSLDGCQAFIDPINTEYHLLIPGSGSGQGTELVYNPLTDEWYPPWDRTVGDANSYLVCGLSLRGTDNRYYTYGGNSEGRVFKLEDDTTDKDESNADVTITHSVKTRAIAPIQRQSTTFEFTFRKAWVEAKAVTSPATKTITVKFYKDMATSGTALSTPGAIDLGNSGYSLAVDGVDASQENCVAFQLEFEASTADLEMELWSFMYSLAVRGEIVQ